MSSDSQSSRKAGAFFLQGARPTWHSPTHSPSGSSSGLALLTLSKSVSAAMDRCFRPRPHRGPGRRGHAARLPLPPTDRACSECLASHLELPLLWAPDLDTPAGLHTLPTGPMAPEAAWLDESPVQQAWVPHPRGTVQAAGNKEEAGLGRDHRGQGAREFTVHTLSFAFLELVLITKA